MTKKTKKSSSSSATKKNRADVLNRLSEKNYSEDLVNNEEESSTGEKKIGRNVINRLIEVEIYDDDPSALAVLKQCILDAELTTQDVYDRIGRQRGYGMIYDLENKNRCTMTVFDLWMTKVLYLDVTYSTKMMSEKEIERIKNSEIRKEEKRKEVSNRNEKESNYSICR